MSIELKLFETSSKFCLHGNQISLLNIIVFSVILQTASTLNIVSPTVEQRYQKQEKGGNHLGASEEADWPEVRDGLTGLTLRRLHDLPTAGKGWMCGYRAQEKQGQGLGCLCLQL